MSASALADEEGRKVFIGGLSFDAREDDLRNDFGKFGDLEDVQLPMGDMGKHKGFAFITYFKACLLYTSPSPRDGLLSRMPSSA